jgi:ribosome-binding protein aMBF1 (putative translation factor)
MTPEQCRAARGWLDWTQGTLAERAHVALSTVKDFEGAKRVPIANNLGAMQVALEVQGIGFLTGDDGKACGITFSQNRVGVK